MKLFTNFKTPPWEQRDAALRAAAVRDESAPELIAKLPEIAAQDAEPTVRRAALARLGVPALLLARHREDPDAATRATALARLSKLLLDPASGLAPGARLAAIGLELPPELLEKVAESALEVEARRAALLRITRPGFLLRRCGEEEDPALRAELFERIDGEDALDRVGEALRKRDKTLARRARERAETMRLARRDPGALRRHAAALCEQLTAWAQGLPPGLEAQLASTRAEWDALAEHYDEAMRTRVAAYFARVGEALMRRSQREIEATAPPQPDAGPEAVAHAVLEGDAGYGAESESESAPAAKRRARLEVDWSGFDAALAEANRALVAKHLGEAKPALHAVHALLASLPKPDRTRRERLTEIEARIEELDQWQRWSGNRVRARLCDEVEALIAASPHPDAVANKVRELQQEWAKVEAAEPGDADRTSGLAKRFRALCGRAMAPTRPYFEQRHALREQRRAAVEALVGEARGDALAALAPPAAIGLRRKLVEALRTLDELEPKARTALARKLREALTRIDAHLDAQREDASLARRKLIARLRRELTHADPAAALALARQAQQEWKALPRAARDQEKALEDELRALVDPLFTREREQLSQAAQSASRVETESRRILDELAALAHGDPAELAHADGRIAALSASWRELHAVPEAPPPRGADRGPRREDRDRRGARDARREPRAARPRDTDRPFDQAVARVRAAQQAREAARRGERLQAIADAIELFALAEQGGLDAAEAASRWDALVLDAGDRRRLAPRWEQATSATTTPDARAILEAQRWLVEAELDAGLDSPAAQQALRREVQMQRLAARLQGGAATAPAPVERLLHFAALGPLDTETASERRERLAALLAAWQAGSG
jgi:exonuclease SbcC